MNSEPSLKEVAKSFLEEHRNNPPEMLWHYTNTRGVLGILRTGKMFATHVAFLNDASEMRYASLPLWRTLQKVLSETQDPLDRQFLYKFGERISNYFSGWVCVVSFSAAKNELSQWRAYGGESGSFSLGFTPAMLQGRCAQQKTSGFHLYKCEYKDSVQSKLCERFVAASLEEFRKAAQTEDEASREGPRICDEALKGFGRIAPLIKHPDFEQENEWRLVSDVLQLERRPFHLREGRASAVPYIDFSFVDDQCENTDQQSAMSSVHLMIGPPHIFSPGDPAIASLAYCSDFRLIPLIEPSLTPLRRV